MLKGEFEMAEKTRKQINRKMVCIICGILAVIVVLTSLIFAFSKKDSKCSKFRR